MNVRRYIRYVLTVVLVIVGVCVATAQPGGRGRKLQNLPFVDNKLVHFGFSVGTHVQDLTSTYNGYTTPEGETWYMEVPSFSPGFCVNLTPTIPGRFEPPPHRRTPKRLFHYLV